MNDDLRAAIAMSLATAAPDPAVEETTTVEAIPREDESAREVEKVETEEPPAKTDGTHHRRTRARHRRRRRR